MRLIVYLVYLIFAIYFQPGYSHTSIDPLKVGKNHAGGVIFKLDESGQHGLIVSKVILSTGITRKQTNKLQYFAKVKGANLKEESSSVLLAIGIGNKRIDFIDQMAADFAVKEDGITKCLTLSDDPCYNDWYLPSRYELNIMYKNLSQLNFNEFSKIEFVQNQDIDRLNSWNSPDFNDADPIRFDNDTIYVRFIRSF